ncbi:hypothetical protein [Xanthomonas campestris]|uniref:hypothetical protein n=1 Tax=Xanthomonas campestris TaxID=339 RepID=UPI001D13A397|nr:hypothetical protein [Xanthomonas campestris]MCC3256149.1 hypothetical protein [Xanthomonas campestris pv. armoraciae]
MPRIEVDWSRTGLFAAIAVFSAAIGWYGQPFIHGNEEARDVIVNVFSILAGFLITVMTLLGEPGLYRGRTWRSDAIKRSNVYQRLVRHKWLFISYLIVLALVFLTTIVTKRKPDGQQVACLEALYLGFATFAFIYSLMLPSRLLNLQLARFDELVESRRDGQKSEG